MRVMSMYYLSLPYCYAVISLCSSCCAIFCIWNENVIGLTRCFGDSIRKDINTAIRTWDTQSEGDR